MTADVVKDRRPRQGTSQDILKGGRGGGRVTMCKREGTYQIALSTSKPCFTQCDKKRLKNGDGGGGGHRHPRTTPPPPPCQLRPRIRFPGSGKQLAFGVSKFHDNRLGTRPSGRVFFFSILRYYLIYLYLSTVYSFLFAFRFPWSDRSLRDQFLANFKISVFAVVP